MFLLTTTTAPIIIKKHTKKSTTISQQQLHFVYSPQCLSLPFFLGKEERGRNQLIGCACASPLWDPNWGMAGERKRAHFRPFCWLASIIVLLFPIALSLFPF